jgi:purine-binding chemotaxis protein CheW
MIRISVLYPNAPGKKFDLDYYAKTHMALVRKRIGGMGLLPAPVPDQRDPRLKSRVRAQAHRAAIPGRASIRSTRVAWWDLAVVECQARSRDGPRLPRGIRAPDGVRECAVADESFQSVLIVGVGTLRCALPLALVVETTRPLPLCPLAGAAEFVLGTSVIRGEPVPVVDLAGLLGAAPARPARFVVVRAGERRVALATDAVIGVRDIAVETMAPVPPLLAVARPDAAMALGVLDRELLLVLQTAHIVPDEVWSLVAESGTR